MIHGGAGVLTPETLSPDADAAARAGLAAALDAGVKVLDAGGLALDAVEAAVRVLEDDPAFNAGRGAALTWDGTAELDAAIMDGRNRAAGAVAGATRTRHPVTLARAVMDNSPHVLLGREGADAFSIEHGLEQAGADWFVVPERVRQLAELRANGGAFDVDMKYGTVGAVARDRHGELAAATSTGGVTGKRWGRIGDSPIIGAGTYADSRAAAISCTGAGEAFIRESVAFQIAARIRWTGEAPMVAAAAVLDEVRALGATGGVIVVNRDGAACWHHTTPGMYRASADADGTRRVAIYGDQFEA